MNTNNLGDLALVKSEIERRHHLSNRRLERPDSSLSVIRRTMRRRHWEETHPGRTR
ncbi:MAG: hypothetical protein L0H79_17765 [Intrasporangium sp.]|uniref:hypothetical protein n=1 Tax=Intrasporangium sp. TaxID=1925024 RepID=UPI002648E202|nr:hypothetical protein [Intrasporangium sp.]MDN5797578.1 hypothetical protein [Intrasporangium sp.]